MHSLKSVDSEEAVWHFLQSYLRPFGVMTGSDMQGGQHEGGENNIATYPVDYVASFLIDGKCRKLNNLWRHHNIAAGNDLALVLRQTSPDLHSIVHVLTSGARTYREERTLFDKPWFYLAPEIVEHSTQSRPYIHIGRAQAMYSSYNSGMGMGRVPWDARACLVGQGVQVTFSPVFNTPDAMRYTANSTVDMDTPVDASSSTAAALNTTTTTTQATAAASSEPPKKKKKRATTAAAYAPTGISNEMLTGGSSSSAHDPGQDVAFEASADQNSTDHAL